MSPRPIRTPTRQERDALAGEYVLGLVDGADLAPFEQRHRARAGAGRSRSKAGARHLAAIDATATPIPPSPGLWPRIEAEIAAMHRPGGRRGRATA